ncbi:MAG: SET domain-containing protein-lysine N-methyltransferase [Verrucomicrobiota bacterium]
MSHNNGQDTLFVHPHIYVKRCEFGFGVFASEFIPTDTLIEECHYIRYRRDECQSMKLNDYVYEMPETQETPEEDKLCNALVLGFGSIYNHSSENNAMYLFDSEKNVFIYQSTRDIQPDEQIFISYGEKWWETRNHSNGADH